ncbi:inclusion body family protein [Pseudomonas chlororaphis]|uniref:AidA/PixA family protein n=1 Tax=Pseudomonas chlororaphis TaxID=587753 RepID=UPI001E5DEDEA|nr:AidA/PixA family protein [Pseudomonas chlororaphis]MCB2255626.1 inclusion body family protein [Pseudomonas chlororaphis]
MSTDTSAPDTAVAHLLLIVDAESLLARYPQPSPAADTPTAIEPGFIFTLGGVHQPQAGDEAWNLRASIGQAFHLRGRTIALRAEHSVLIYRITLTSHDVLSPPELQVKPAQNIPTLDLENLDQPIAGTADDHFWRFTHLAPGVETFGISFMLVDTECQVLGYFQREFEVTVTEPGAP